jgi:hypothetical protein
MPSDRHSGESGHNGRHHEKESAMSSFMLLLHRPVERSRPTDPETMTRVTREYMDWADRMRADGRLKGGSKLTDDAGRILRAKDGRVTTIDGPFIESKEIVGGYFLISAGDYAEACRIASECPHLKYGSHIEVRQVEEL